MPDGPIDVKVTAQDNVTIKTYAVSISRAAIPPTVTTLPATGIATNSATLQGTV